MCVKQMTKNQPQNPRPNDTSNKSIFPNAKTGGKGMGGRPRSATNSNGAEVVPQPCALLDQMCGPLCVAPIHLADLGGGRLGLCVCCSRLIDVFTPTIRWTHSPNEHMGGNLLAA